MDILKQLLITFLERLCKKSSNVIPDPQQLSETDRDGQNHKFYSVNCIPAESSNQNIEQVNLSPEKIKEILLGSAVKEGIKLFPGLGKVFQVAENINQEFRQAQLSILLQEFGSRFDNLKHAQEQLIKLWSSKAGMILFQKIVHVLDNGDFDEEWLSLLSNALYSISNSDFKKQFDQHSYIISQINQLSAQSLLLLSHFDLWSGIKFTGSTTMSGQTIVGNRHDQLATFFSSKKAVKDGLATERIKHSFNDLESKGMYFITEGKGVQLSQVGTETLEYIS